MAQNNNNGFFVRSAMLGHGAPLMQPDLHFGNPHPFPPNHPTPQPLPVLGPVLYNQNTAGFPHMNVFAVFKRQNANPSARF